MLPSKGTKESIFHWDNSQKRGNNGGFQRFPGRVNRKNSTLEKRVGEGTVLLSRFWGKKKGSAKFKGGVEKGVYHVHTENKKTQQKGGHERSEISNWGAEGSDKQQSRGKTSKVMF